MALQGQTLTLKLRSRVEAFKGSGEWQEVSFVKKLEARQTAVLLCDMWDNHWCKGAVKREIPIAKKAIPMLELARQRGLLIIHAPSETMEFYKAHPARLAMLKMPSLEPPPNRTLADPPLPIDDKDGGCDTGDSFYKAWTREIALIPIDDHDLISDDGRQVYSALKERGIRTVLVMGVHANMCILNRTFAIKQMTRWGVPMILIRDLTDTMYNPKSRPFVAHEKGTELVIEHIEKYWAPTVLSDEVVRALR